VALNTSLEQKDLYDVQNLFLLWITCLILAALICVYLNMKSGLFTVKAGMY